MASRILPVKNYGSQSRASEANGMALATIIFYWYYSTGHIRTCIIIQVNLQQKVHCKTGACKITCEGRR